MATSPSRHAAAFLRDVVGRLHDILEAGCVNPGAFQKLVNQHVIEQRVGGCRRGTDWTAIPKDISKVMIAEHVNFRLND